MIDESWYVKPDRVKERTAAGGVIYRIDHGELLLALVSEGAEKKWILPKGGVDKGESLLQAAKREIAEEAGITDLKHMGEIASYSRLNYFKDKWVTTHYFLFETTQVECFPTDKSHDYKTVWFSAKKIPVMFWPEQLEVVEKALKVLTKTN